MNILFVTHRYWPYPGGAERYVQEMSERFHDEGHGVTVITTDAWDIEHFFSKGKKKIDRPREIHNGVPITRVRVRRLPFHRHASRLLSSLPSMTAQALFTLPSPWVPALRRELERVGDLDIVHSSAFPYDSLIYHSYTHARGHNLPFVLTPFLHFGEPHEASHIASRLSRFQKFALRNSDRVIVQTRREEEAAARAGASPDRVEVLGVGVNPQELIGGDGARFRTRYDIAPGDIVILHVAEKSYQKGSIHLVEAVKSIRHRIDGIKIVLGGDSMSDFRNYMERQEKDIRDICVYPGYIPEEEKKDMFAACDIYAMPSKTDTFGIVYLEAWLSRKPVIGAMAGGVPDVITDGIDGFLVPFGNVYMLTDYLWTLIRSRELRGRMGGNGCRKVVSHHTWDKIYAGLKEIFLSVLSGERHGGTSG